MLVPGSPCQLLPQLALTRALASSVCSWFIIAQWGTARYPRWCQELYALHLSGVNFFTELENGVVAYEWDLPDGRPARPDPQRLPATP